MKKANILLYDIETAPSLGYVWQKYETNVLAVKKEWDMLSFAYKWLGEKTISCLTRQDFRDKTDKTLLKKLWTLFDKADVVVGHNSDQFDNKKANARFVAVGLQPPQPYQTIDTKKVAKRYFNFYSNSLDDLGQTLGVGRKVKHTGFDLWLGCMANDSKSWALMSKYNKQDVALLERVYLKLLPWIDNHPNVARLDGKTDGCPKCGSNRLKSYGVRLTKTSTFRRYRCLSCLGFCRERISDTGVKKPRIVNI